MEIRAVVSRYRFVVFAGLTLSAAALVFAAGLDPQMEPFALVLLPALAAIATAAVAGGGELRRLGRRITRWRVRPSLYLAAIGIPIVGTLLINVLAVANGTPISDVFSGLTAAALVVPLVVLLPAIFEELGWRGFGLPALGRMPLLWSALVVGIPFTLIHLPLHLPGHLYEHLPMWPSVLSLVAYSLLLAWIFSISRGSALLAALMHAAANGAVSLTWGIDSVVVWEMRGIAFAIVALVVVALAWRKFTAPALSTSPEPELTLAPRPAG